MKKSNRAWCVVCLALLGSLGCQPQPAGNVVKGKNAAPTTTTTTAAPESVAEASQTTDTPDSDVTANESPEPARPTGELVEISFDDLNIQLQADVVFRPWMLNDRVKELEGRRVRISGYMLPGSKLENINEFVLLRNTECKFGPGGKADHLLTAKLRESETTVFSDKPIEIEGTLAVNPFQGPDGNTWSIYDLTDVTGIKTVRR